MGSDSRRPSRIGLDKIKYYISVASPLGMMRTMDGINPPKDPNDSPVLILPESLVERHINIFHPSDPVAYRLEPLIHNFYEKIIPIKIHKSNDKVINDYESVGVNFRVEIKTRHERRQERKREKAIIKKNKSDLKEEQKQQK